LKVYTINPQTKEKEILIDDIKVQGYDPPINFFPDIDNETMLITYGDKEYHKKISEIEVVCNRPGEMQEFNKYLIKMKIDANNRRKYFKRAEVFYNNFKHDVSIISKIVHNEEGEVAV